MIAQPVELLLVEDNPCDAKLTLHVLKKNDFPDNVKIAADGAEALEYLFGVDERGKPHMQHPPRLILLDLKLPKVNGFEVLRRIKCDPLTKSIPVVVLTSSRADQDLRLCYELGANSYVVKPIEFDEFSEAIQLVQRYWLLSNEARPTEQIHSEQGCSAQQGQ